jgi:trk system potassium uptake protein
MKNIVLKLKENIGSDAKSSWKVFTPINIIVIGYILLILAGAFILMLPFSTVSGKISFTDALFTSTSAATVTGLVVKETGTYFTFFGQLIIVLLIQIGGIGYMSIFGFFLLSGEKKSLLSKG